MDDKDIIGWFSLENGTHIPIRRGETRAQATKRFLSQKTSRVEKNQNKYDKTDEFKRRKESNKLKNDDEEIEYLDLNEKNDKNDSRLSKFDKSDDGRKYTLKPEELEKVNKELGLKGTRNVVRDEKEEFYESLGKWHAVDSAGKNHPTYGEFLYISTDSDLQKEIYDKLDPIVEKGGTPTKDQVREVIENYRQRKLSSKTPKDTSPSKSEAESLHKEYDYLTKEMERLASGRQFWVRDNPSNPANYLMGHKDFMSAKEREEYDKVKRQRDAIHDRITALRNKW